MNKPVNVYGQTLYYEYGSLEGVYDGIGFRDNEGNITWYNGYNPPKDDENHSTMIISFGKDKDLSIMP